LQEIKSTYFLMQHKHGKSVSLQWLARNQIHVLPDAAQARQEHQSPMACKKSNPRNELMQHKHGKNVSLRWLARNQIHVQSLMHSTSTERTSVSDGLQEIKSTYVPDAAQARQERQSPMACKKSNPRTY
jgi:hypothetical protein